MADLVAELEAALTSAGTLLVWAEKYRHPDPGALPALRRQILGLGDHARHLSRAGALDEGAARELLDVLTTANRATRRLIDDVRSAAIYRRATEAQTAGDMDRLTAFLPSIFADLEAAAPPPAAFWTPTWQRRGRPLPADRIAADLLELRTNGIPAIDDDLSPAVDPELPGVLLSSTGPLGAPLALRYDAAVLPAPCLRLGEDQVLMPGPRLRLRFAVALASPDEPLDEWVADPATYLDALGVACRHAGLEIVKLPTPAASS
jgi:hypothetical protein